MSAPPRRTAPLAGRDGKISEASRNLPARTRRVKIEETITAFQIRILSLTEELREVLTALSQFAAGRETKTVSEITADEISAWLDGNGWSVSTRITYLRRLETFFAWAAKKGYSASNPTAGVERPTGVETPVVVLSVRDCRRILETCRYIDPGLLPYFAIGLFAGIRPDEIKRLTKDRIKESGFIEVQADKAKTRRRRLVEIHPTLRLWLDVDGGEIGWKNWRRRWRAVREATCVGDFGPERPVAWAADVMRHTFCSYSYPIKGAAWTANESGHRESTLFAHYRELVTEGAAREFWAITPEASAQATHKPLAVSAGKA